jgi:hypothetical protein
MRATLRKHSEEWTKMATMGWTSQLTKLDKRFGTT